MTNEELMRRYLEKENDDDILEKLYEQNVGLLKTIAKDTAAAFHCIRYETDSYGYTEYTQILLDDLFSEGALAMFRKIRERDYDERRGKFSTYIYPHVKGALYRYLEQNAGNVSLPQKQFKRIREVQAMYAEGYRVGYIATELGLSERVTADLIRRNTHFLSIYDFVPNERIEWDSDYDPFEFIPIENDATLPTDKIVYKKIQMELLELLFDTLSARDRYLLGHYYGVFGRKKKTLDDIGLDLMLTVDGVRKAIKIATENLRSAYKDSKLKIWHDAYAMINKAQKNVG